MAKRPFSIRMPEQTIERFRALVMVLDLTSEQLLTEMVKEKEKELSAGQKAAYESLIKAWAEK